MSPTVATPQIFGRLLITSHVWLLPMPHILWKMTRIILTQPFVFARKTRVVVCFEPPARHIKQISAVLSSISSSPRPPCLVHSILACNATQQSCSGVNASGHTVYHRRTNLTPQSVQSPSMKITIVYYTGEHRRIPVHCRRDSRQFYFSSSLWVSISSYLLLPLWFLQQNQQFQIHLLLITLLRYTHGGYKVIPLISVGPF